ncbi:MAG: GNAT family N-acetyltransferase [Magnetococcales bacterium]|nr:GNAT family N-acetyltransferase [Magnetococcales bacterium]
MDPSDLESVAACEAELSPFPWNVTMLADELRHGSFCRVLLSEENERIGYMLLRPILDEWHLMTIGVTRSHQRQGWGRYLLLEGIRHAVRQQGRVLLLDVRASNLPARRLYDSLGFRLLHRRRHYYSSCRPASASGCLPCPAPTEDALVMELSLASIHSAVGPDGD